MENIEQRKTDLINQLEEEHRKQRGWQRLVGDERLDKDYLRTLSVEELEKALEGVRK